MADLMPLTNIQPSTNISTSNALFNAAINLLLAARCVPGECSNTSCIPTPNWPEDGSDNITDTTFDFIIVGAGSAGSVLANRLSENQCWRILLIEAGGDPPFSSTIPALAVDLQNTESDWQLKSINDSRVCQGMKGGQCAMARGKMLGGTSSMNYMHYVRGNSLDYDDLAEGTDSGWRYNDVWKYFTKSENLSHPQVKSHPILKQYHGYNGYLSVTAFSIHGTQPIIVPYVKSMEEMGLPLVLDVNGPFQYSSVRSQANIQDGQRESTATAFLVPVRDRPNLVIWKNAFVTKVRIENKIATGVEVRLKNRTEVRTKARKEVILSGGAISTPQILLLSGIGPADHLGDLKIDVVADLPVGRNLYDHPCVPTVIGVRGIQSPPIFKSVAQYVANRTGPLAQFGLGEILTFYNTRNSIGTRPDMMIFSIFIGANMPDTVNRLLGLHFNWNQRTVDSFMKYNQEMGLVFIFHLGLNQKSRGRIWLNNTDPTTPPIYYPNFFSETEDLETFLNSIEYMNNIVNTTDFRRLQATLLPFDNPACNSIKFPSRAYWSCVVFNFGSSGNHNLGTAKMGSKSDPTTAVDPNLRVHGVDRLRVVDGSVIPSRISGDTNAPIIMVAERAADFIKVDHKFEKVC